MLEYLINEIREEWPEEAKVVEVIKSAKDYDELPERDRSGLEALGITVYGDCWRGSVYEKGMLVYSFINDDGRILTHSAPLPNCVTNFGQEVIDCVWCSNDKVVFTESQWEKVLLANDDDIIYCQDDGNTLYPVRKASIMRSMDVEIR